jgi:hypothetical protein
MVPLGGLVIGALSCEGFWVHFLAKCRLQEVGVGTNNS